MENSENTGNFIPPFQTQQEPKRKTPVALIVAVIVLVLGLLGLGTAYYFQMSQANDLQRQVNDLNAAAEEMDREMAAMHEEPVAEYREIPELGVRYKLTDETKDLTYSYEGMEEMDHARFATTALVKMKDSENLYPCTQGSSGMIVRAKSGEVPQKSDTPVKKIGDYDFVYTAPQNMCEVDGKIADGLVNSTNAVKKAFETLEAIPTP